MTTAARRMIVDERPPVLPDWSDRFRVPYPTEQTIFGNGEGNCFTACVASLFPVAINDIPHFCKLYEDEWFVAFREWAWEKLDLWPVMFDYPALPENERSNIGRGFVLIGGMGPRDCHHAVVGWLNHSGMGLVHDPHPGSRGLISIDDVMTFSVPIWRVSM